MAFRVGEFISWGSFFASASTQILQTMWMDRKLAVVSKHSPLPNKIVYWISISTLAFIVQSPNMYVSYIYTNRSLFWPLFNGMVNALFTLNSLNGSIKKLSCSNNFFTRWLYRSSGEIKIFQAAKNVCLALEAFQAVDDSVKKRCLDMIHQTAIHQEEIKPLLFILEKGFEKRLEVESLDHQASSAGTYFIPVATTILFLSNYCLRAKLGYNSFGLITDEVYLLVFLIVLSTIPDSYLNGSIIYDCCKEVFWQNIRSLHQLKASGIPLLRPPLIWGLKKLPALALSVFGLGSTVTLVRENFGFEKYAGLSFLILISNSFLILNSMISLSNKMFDWIQFKFSDTNKKSIIQLSQRVDDFAHSLSRASKEEMKLLLGDIEASLHSSQSLTEMLSAANCSISDILKAFEEL